MLDGSEPTLPFQRATVASLRPVDDRGDTIAASTDGAARLDRNDRRYVVRSELARGGMGRISVADDTLLGRTVALKELLVPSGPLAARFGRELALSARLQHPAIVSIHDAGTWPNGEPYYVMKLVRGESLDRVIARTTNIGERIALVPNAIAMTDALAYAHSQNIIHRDLKPGNVLVGDFGETVVIDWGLAKDLAAADVPAGETGPYRDAVAGATIEGSVLGTPAYMPPEQAAGETVDERSDVYALGAVLYHVLSGAPPYTGSSSIEILAAVVDGPPSPLALRVPGLPPDLLAIVDKAMARAPDQRYASAGELAVDLKRFQSGQLVLAHRYSASQLVRRWIRKHRTAVAVAAIAMLLLLGLGAVSFRRVVAEQHQTEAERQLADHHRANAEELMSFMLFDLREKLEPLGRVELLDTVARKARDYYDSRPEALTASDQNARAHALHNLGSVLLDQGHVAEASSELYRSLAIDQALVMAAPARVGYQRELGLVHNTIGAALHSAGDTTGAIGEFRAALAIATHVAEIEPSNDGVQRDLASGHRKLGRMLATKGDLDAALTEARTSVAIVERVASDGAQRDLAESHDDIGFALTAQGKTGEALAEYRIGLAITDKLAASDRANALLQNDLMVSHNRISELLVARGDSAEGLAESRIALAISARQSASDPANARWRRDLATNHQNVGLTLLGRGDLKGALEEYRANLAISEQLAAADPTNVEAARDLAIAHTMIGNAVWQTDPKQALAHFRAQLAIIEPLATKDATNADWQSDLIVGHMGIGDALGALEDRASIVEYRTCVALAKQLITLDPSSWQAKQNLQLAYNKVGGELMEADDPPAALVEFRSALALAAQLAAHDPASANYQRQLSVCHHRIAWALEESRDYAAAVIEYRTTLAIHEALVVKDPSNAALKAAEVHLKQELAHCAALVR